MAGNAYHKRIDLLIRTRMFNDLFDIASLDLHPLRGDRRGQYAIRLHGRWRLVVQPNPAWDSVDVLEVSNHYDE